MNYRPRNSVQFDEEMDKMEVKLRNYEIKYEKRINFFNIPGNQLQYRSTSPTHWILDKTLQFFDPIDSQLQCLKEECYVEECFQVYKFVRRLPILEDMKFEIMIKMLNMTNI